MIGYHNASRILWILIPNPNQRSQIGKSISNPHPNFRFSKLKRIILNQNPKSRNPRKLSVKVTLFTVETSRGPIGCIILIVNYNSLWTKCLICKILKSLRALQIWSNFACAEFGPNIKLPKSPSRLSAQKFILQNYPTISKNIRWKRFGS